MIFVKKISIALLITCIATSCFSQELFFHRDFAPSDRFVKPVERPYRDDVCLNGYWQFMPVYEEALAAIDLKNPEYPGQPAWEKIPIRIPSPWNINSFASKKGGDFTTYPEYPAQWEKARAGWLKCNIPYRKEWKGKRLFIRFEAVSGYAQVIINKKKIGENFDLFLPFEIDITDEICETGENELLVWIADAKLFNRASEKLRNARRIHVGGSFWGEHIIGIWQDVNLLVKSPVRIQNVFIKPDLDKNELEIEALIVNNSIKKQKLSLSGDIMPWINRTDQTVLSAPEVNWELGNKILSTPAETIEIEPGSTQTIQLKTKVDGNLKTWTSENPELYGLVLNLNDKKQTIDKTFNRFGWRQFSVRGKEFLLNGKPVYLKGDSWHFMGIPQMTRRYAWSWYNTLKEMGGNAVRLHAQPYPEFYLDMADEMGIFVLDETGMWASDGGPNADSEEYWKNAEDHLRRMIMRDRNHPSVFGWSVCNENIAVVAHVQNAPEAIIQRQVDEINKWVAVCRELDPTRVWISGDGETNRKTDLPIVPGHYGHEREMKQWSTQYPIWGIGEQCMAYAGTPIEASKFAGERAYESMLGRMEGVAAEALELLNIQKKYKANFMSVFNVAWYGLKPLEIGLKDTTRTPEMMDGVYFGTYQQGKPGIQPGRLGPYTTTFNPGYDPNLPLFKTWPLYDAVKLSFSNKENIPQQWNKKEIPNREITVQPAASVCILSDNPYSVLHTICKSLDIVTQTTPSKKGNDLLIIDGKYPPSDPKSHTMLKETLERGGRVFIWGVSPVSVEALNKLLPVPVELTTRKASSFLVQDDTSILQHLGNSDFYFSEISKDDIMLYGLTGNFVTNGKILLDACNTNWRTWNHQPEYSKTGSVLRSEREKKHEGNALIEYPWLNGKIFLCSLEADQFNQFPNALLRRLFLNLGATFDNSQTNHITVINDLGQLQQALVLGSFDIGRKTVQEAAEVDFLKGSLAENYRPGNETNNRFWEIKEAKDGIFNFKEIGLPGNDQQAIAYVSFWIYSPRSLTNLLEEPDMPQLNMYLGVDDAFQVYLNKHLVKDYIREGSLEKRDQCIEKLPLERGWNHILIKVIQGGGGWELAVEFDCDKKSFLKQLKYGVTGSNMNNH